MSVRRGYLLASPGILAAVSAALCGGAAFVTTPEMPFNPVTNDGQFRRRGDGGLRVGPTKTTKPRRRRLKGRP
jgi:hypothetical protein